MGKEIQTVSSNALQVDEVLEVKRCRYTPEGSNHGLPRLCFVTGIHGDELEGQYLSYEIGRKIMSSPEKLKGIVDIYPSINPLGIDAITRGIPGYDLDMNRIFPGRQGNTLVESVADHVVDSLLGADLVIDYHASNIFLNEIPQARIMEQFTDSLLPMAKKMNLDFIWVHPSVTMLESTLSYCLNIQGTPCVVVEAGIGMRITKSYGDQIVDGIFNLLGDMGIWEKEAMPLIRPPFVSTEENVVFINAESSGIFIPEADHCQVVQEGAVIGNVVDPLEGKVLEIIRAQCQGILFTIRSYPLVYQGSLIGRIFKRGEKGEKDA